MSEPSGSDPSRDRREPIVCTACGDPVRVVCHWRHEKDDTFVYDGPYLACGCTENEVGGRWAKTWTPESEVEQDG